MITAQIERITPTIAGAMLDGNQDNRRLSESLVFQYAADMAAGKWKLTGQPIIIADDGQLNDGQHRLAAIAKSGVVVEMMVLRGADRQSRDAIDTGKPRTAGDVVQMFHIPDGTAVAALARSVIGWERAGKNRLGAHNNISKSEIIERARADQRLIYANRVGKTCDKIAMYKHISFARYAIPDGALSDMFFDRLADGVGLENGHPVLTVRNWFFRNGRRVPDMQGIEAILRGWCAFKDGREITYIKILGEFPTP